MTTPLQGQRLRSLDIFRGVTIAAMILVNDPGSWADSYAQLKHAAWHGWTMTDMIFPFFLWIMGVAMTLSFAKRRAVGATRKSLVLHALRRSVIIFALGLIVNGFPFGIGAPFSLATWRIPGVLQRIAVCYFVAAVLFLYARTWALAIWSAGFLAVYWLAMMLVPVPGYGAGVLDPVGNLGWFLDSHIIGAHTWVYAPAKGFDPEGIISTLPAFATTLFGVLTGLWLRTEKTPREKTAGMALAGIAFLAAGLIANIWLPINKNLWTSSFALFMGGWALVCFAACYWVMDVRGSGKWLMPFDIFGKNAITLYVASELLATLIWIVNVRGADGSPVSVHDAVYDSLFASWLAPVNASLGFALLYVFVMFVIGWVMWKAKWFVKV